MHSEMNYGVALLTTGSSGAAWSIALDIFKQLQPSLDQLLTKNSVDNYAGTWGSAGLEESDSIAVLIVEDGSLWINKLILNGTDVLRMTQGLADSITNEATMPAAMWSTKRQREFRSVLFQDEVQHNSEILHPQEWHLEISAVALDNGRRSIVDLREDIPWI